MKRQNPAIFCHLSCVILPQLKMTSQLLGTPVYDQSRRICLLKLSHDWSRLEPRAAVMSFSVYSKRERLSFFNKWRVSKFVTVMSSQAWALFKGKYREGVDKPDPPTWKTRLRCALNKSNDFEELVGRSQLDISDPYKVYQIIPEGAKKSERHHFCRQAAGKYPQVVEVMGFTLAGGGGPFFSKAARGL